MVLLKYRFVMGTGIPMRPKQNTSTTGLAQHEETTARQLRNALDSALDTVMAHGHPPTKAVVRQGERNISRANFERAWRRLRPPFRDALCLSERESRLLAALCLAEGSVVTYDELCEVSGDPYLERDTLSAAIQRLRRKCNVEISVTYGLGYALDEWQTLLERTGVR